MQNLTLCVCVCVCQGLIKRQEGEISDSLELFQRAVTLNPNSSAAVKQVARSLYVNTFTLHNHNCHPSFSLTVSSSPTL